MPARTLDEKIDLALSRLARVRRAWGGRVRVAWTAGKDSTVVLDMWRRVMSGEGVEDGGVAAGDDYAAQVAAINLDTGCKFPEIVTFRDQLAREWDVDLHVARPEGVDAQYPVARDKLACCRDLKVVPLKAAVRQLGVRALLTGLRADEHPSRVGRGWVERRRDPHYAMINPILEFTEMDVWAYHMQQGLAYCSLYDQGYRSLGCVPCTAVLESEGDGERAGRDQEKERSLEALRSLGYF